jgi:hypothetical protein
MLPRNMIISILKYSFFIYVGATSLLGTLGIIYFFSFFLLDHPPSTPLYLANGFILKSSEDSPSRIVVFDKNKNLIIHADVKRFQWHEKTLYGFRQSIDGQTKYFVCHYGAPCDRQQDYNEGEFLEEIRRKGLPIFSYHQAESYQHLLRKEWKKEKSRPVRTEKIIDCPNDELLKKGYQVCWCTGLCD